MIDYYLDELYKISPIVKPYFNLDKIIEAINSKNEQSTHKINTENISKIFRIKSTRINNFIDSFIRTKSLSDHDIKIINYINEYTSPESTPETHTFGELIDIIKPPKRRRRR